jgi:alkylation response protein AidB-like acyl-CoA dehydrogenase
VDFDLDEQQVMIRDLAGRFAAGRYELGQRTAYRSSPEGFSRENWAMLAELGLLALPFPAEHGGFGAGAIEIVTVMEELGKGLATEPFLADLLLGGGALARAGDEALLSEWLPRIIAGQARVALAHFEHEARFNPLYVRTRAQREGQAPELNGAKTFVLSGEGVDAYVVSAREDGAPDDAQGLSLWLVPAEAAGLERRAYRLTDGSVACELRLHAVKEAQRLDGGADALLATFDVARLAACGEMVGIMATLFEATLDHVRTRRQFGQPIGSFQAVQHRMADAYVLLEQSRSHLLRAALLPGDARPRAAAIAAAKAFIGASAVKLGEECIQFHGGMGTTDELAIGHGHKRLLLLATLLGDPDSELMRYGALIG